MHFYWNQGGCDQSNFQNLMSTSKMPLYARGRMLGWGGNVAAAREMPLKHFNTEISEASCSQFNTNQAHSATDELAVQGQSTVKTVSLLHEGFNDNFECFLYPRCHVCVPKFGLFWKC
ncbi:uncharacterized protein A4U43_C03F25020 [Asparagus officinalis]|uniref:Uncharacterized protein n=1 Tax=Asparagus officinalis TaxID=4686 RepID=A0A5P1FHS8_ASPOF|nr:uncharacterized protein A4U43_C03F25020 [Asparagus officinalis]